MAALGINVSEAPPRTTIALTGELDLETCPQVTTVTDELRLRGTTLRVDLSGVTFIGSTSLNMLLSLRLRAEAEGGHARTHRPAAPGGARPRPDGDAGPVPHPAARSPPVAPGVVGACC
ncbi:STAS domain-containing protein [Actinacidiphila glaucinigra]|uniref:STAS domain-containing protein n=1 Tax=Actinacidiphila glaucinigra TaxID=235986 RepID=UPI00386FEAC5